MRSSDLCRSETRQEFRPPCNTESLGDFRYDYDFRLQRIHVCRFRIESQHIHLRVRVRSPDQFSLWIEHHTGRSPRGEGSGRAVVACARFVFQVQGNPFFQRVIFSCQFLVLNFFVTIHPTCHFEELATRNP